MKWIALILGLLLIPLVLAGNSYDIDFSQGPTHVATLQEGDELRVYYNDSVHSIILDQINYEESILNFEIFINQKNYSKGIVYEGVHQRLDFERDGIKDVQIDFYEIDGDDATIILKDLQYEEPDATGNIGKDIGLVNSKKPLLKYVLIGVLILVGILGFRNFGKPTTGLQVEEPEKTELPKEVEEELDEEEATDDDSESNNEEE